MNGMNWSVIYHIQANDMFIECKVNDRETNTYRMNERLREEEEKKMSNISDDEYERSCLIEHPKK